ncbi:hypothetical protein [Paenibacillus tepidiphilus]|uniref:hypothetical protein n=1 Tax=Paenibacillus tepidiphilus TaxID=2608683 RepID=UPI00123A7468|nr:hypothetical protein [Paenibacillus tepidiphilus]
MKAHESKFVERGFIDVKLTPMQKKRIKLLPTGDCYSITPLLNDEKRFEICRITDIQFKVEVFRSMDLIEIMEFEFPEEVFHFIEAN